MKLDEIKRNIDIKDEYNLKKVEREFEIKYFLKSRRGEQIVEHNLKRGTVNTEAEQVDIMKGKGEVNG